VKRFLLTTGALAAWLLAGHFGLLAILVYVWASAMSTTNTPKARSTEQRVNGLVSSVGAANTRVNNLSGQNVNGTSATAGLANGTIGGSSGQINTGGGTAHTHGPGSYAVNSGQHSHGPGSYSLPTV
jgi:hypothetical protein